jgi:hypothetical protein
MHERRELLTNAKVNDDEEEDAASDSVDKKIMVSLTICLNLLLLI